MQISVKHNINQALQRIAAFTPKQAPFAVALALTKTAQAVQREFTAELPRVFDRPTPFTLRAFRVSKATKRKPEAIVFAMDRQARYLKFGTVGGRRRVKGFEYKFGAQTDGDERQGKSLVPTRNIKLDSKGNVSLATIKRISEATNSSGKAKRFFVGKPRGGGKNADRGYGVYARVNNNKRIESLMVFAQEPRYRMRFDRAAIGRRVIDKVFGNELVAAFERAMQTAR